jgi:competence protein ComGC
MKTTPAPPRRTFTLINRLMVIDILAILAALLLPALSAAKQKAWRIGCLNNLRQLNRACKMYADDNGGDNGFQTGPSGLAALQ